MATRASHATGRPHLVLRVRRARRGALHPELPVDVQARRPRADDPRRTGAAGPPPRQLPRPASYWQGAMAAIGYELDPDLTDQTRVLAAHELATRTTTSRGRGSRSSEKGCSGPTTSGVSDRTSLRRSGADRLAAYHRAPVDVSAGLPFEAVFESGLVGLVPGVEVSIIDNVGNTVLAATGVGIVEQTIDGNPDTGIYAVTLTAPATPASTRSSGRGTAPSTTSPSRSRGSRSSSRSTLPTVPDGDGTVGPCSLWADIDVDRSTAATSIPPALTRCPATKLTAAMTRRRRFLYFASGKQFAGCCERTVRPCDSGSACGCGVQVLSRGHLVGWDGELLGGFHCGCSSVSYVKLAGYVARDHRGPDRRSRGRSGRLLRRRSTYLVRKNGRWPACQAMDVEDDRSRSLRGRVRVREDASPARAGCGARAGLRDYKSCTPGAGECALPTGRDPRHAPGHHDRAHLHVAGPARHLAHRHRCRRHVPERHQPSGLSRGGVFWSPNSQARYAQGGRRHEG